MHRGFDLHATDTLDTWGRGKLLRAYFKDKQLVGQTYEKGPKTLKAYPRPDHTHENLLATVPFIYGIGPGWFIIF